MKIITSKDDILRSSQFETQTKRLYGGLAEGQMQRYLDLYVAHVSRFSAQGFFVSSSGRIEVCGNHTDHNNGKVLAAAISVDTLAFVTPVSGGKICISSCGYPAFSIDTRNLEPYDNELGTSLALVKGVCKWFLDNGYKIGGFNATMVSDVFKGAGVSSSASFEVLIAEVLNIVYNGNTVTKIQKAQAAQYAENVYFGKPCGLMDQSAIALGGISRIDFRDTKAPVVESFEWCFPDVDIFLVNTGGDHSDLTDNYASIRYEMEEVAEFFDKRTLRFVDEAEFYKSLPELQKKVSGRAILRAMHFFDENRRIGEAVGYIQAKDINGFADVINRSGESSYKLLQNCYAEGDVAQRIPLALALSREVKGVLATRVHGGGFMGTILTFVESGSSDAYYNTLKPVFGENNIFKLTIREAGAVAVEL